MKIFLWWFNNGYIIDDEDGLIVWNKIRFMKLNSFNKLGGIILYFCGIFYLLVRLVGLN